jgi:hypothetical protein
MESKKVPGRAMGRGILPMKKQRKTIHLDSLCPTQFDSLKGKINKGPAGASNTNRAATKGVSGPKLLNLAIHSHFKAAPP